MSAASPVAARAFHGLTGGLAAAFLVLQLVLVIDGASVLVTDDPPGLWLRLGRFVSYFTIQSNVLVCVAALWLAADPRADDRWFRAVRLAGVVGITVTGLVHFVLLRPLLDLHGWSALADTGLHLVVPVMAVVGWLLLGPRSRVDRTAVAVAFAWPLCWLAWTVVIGATTGWFPYPFLDWRLHSAASVAFVCLAVTVLFAGLIWLAVVLDRRIPHVRRWKR